MATKTKKRDLFAPGGQKRRKGVDLLTASGKRRTPKASKAKASAAALKKKRATKLDRDPLYNPQAPLSGRALARAALDLTRLEYGPQENLLTEEGKDVERQGAAQQGRARTMFQDLARREAFSIARHRALGDMVSGNLSKLSAETQAKLKSSGAEADQRAGQDESTRGKGLEGGSTAQRAAEQAAQEARSAKDSQSYRSAAELQSGGYQGLANASAQSRQTRGAEATREISNRILNSLAENRARKRELGTKRSQAKTKHLLDLRQQGFENIATVQGLGLKEADIAADADKAKRDRSLARSRIKETRKHNQAGEARLSGSAAETARHNRATEDAALKRLNKKGEKKGKFTATKKRENRSTFRKAVGLIRISPEGKKYLRPGGGAKLRTALVGKNYDPLIARAASEYAIYGGVFASTRRAVKRNFGITLPLYKKKPGKKPLRAQGRGNFS